MREKYVGSSFGFPLSACHSHISVQFLLKLSDCAKTIAKSYIPVFSQRVCVNERLLEVKISSISCKLKATYVFVFVRSAIFDVSIL